VTAFPWVRYSNDALPQKTPPPPAQPVRTLELTAKNQSSKGAASRSPRARKCSLPVGTESPVNLRDLGIFADQVAEPVSAENLNVLVAILEFRGAEAEDLVSVELEVTVAAHIGCVLAAVWSSA
jgi:hypothetical protein